MDLTKTISQRSEIENLSFEEFSDEKVYQRIDSDLNDPEYFQEPGKALDFAAALSGLLKKYPSLEKEKPELFKKYKNLIDLLEIFAIPSLNKEELENIFSHKITIAFEKDINLMERINRLYQSYNYYPDMIQELRELLLKSLVNNKETLGKGKITVRGTEIEPYLGGFIFDYNLTYNSTSDSRTPVKQSNYISNSENAKKLSEQEKLLLLRAIRLYDFIIIPSLNRQEIPHTYDFSPERIKVANQLTAESKEPKVAKAEFGDLDIEDADIEITDSGIRVKFGSEPTPSEISEISPEQKSIKRKAEQKIRESIEKYKELLMKVKDEEENVLVEINKNPENTSQILIQSVNNKESEKATAVLLIMARLKKIKNLITEMSGKKIFMEEVIPLLKKQIPGISEPELMDKFKQDSQNPVYVKIIIKYILTKVFEGRREEAAFLATQLENTFSVLEQPEYIGMAYYNLKTEKYEWANVKMTEQGELIME